ncbi:hypothetical protein [uncultured Sphaerotilus sp.]|uniref:hypothetical protein n=1 Tax=uncultured Sphaerotilus sp. TaxID=474984 RepID=UPI0030CA5ABC
MLTTATRSRPLASPFHAASCCSQSTHANRLLNTPEKLRDYFEKLGSREELSIALHDKTLLVQDLPGRLCALGGIYNWRFMVDGELLNFEARFSYVVDLARPQPILHHHSSQIPRML